MKPEYIIRIVTKNDAAALLAFSKAVGSESHYLSFGKEGIPCTVEQEAAFIESVQNNRLSCMWCVEYHNEIIALCSFDANNNKRMAHRAGISLSVRKAYWKQGIATLMMNTMIAHAKKHPEITMLTLEVLCDNKPAIHLYEKFSFTYCGCLHQFFLIEDTYYDAYMMECDLRKGAYI